MLVVDALDELPALRFELLDKLRSLSPTKLNIMITCRPEDEYTAQMIMCSNCGKLPLQLYHHCDICDGGDFDLCQGCVDKHIHCYVQSHQLVQPMEEVSVNIEPTDEDIRRYVEHELDKELKLGTVATRDSRLCQSAKGMTRLARIFQQMPESRLIIP